MTTIWRSWGSVIVAVFMLTAVSVAPAGFIWAEDGAPADNPPAEAQETVSDTGDSSSELDSASVTTGDATAGTEVQNEINTNTVDTASDTSEEPAPTTSTEASTESETTEPPTEAVGEGDAPLTLEASDGETGTTTLTLENENIATSTTDAISIAETGENEASTETGTASVDSGNSYAYANVANLVNTNFVQSNGAFQLLNFFGNIFGELSLSMESGAGCSFLCYLTELFVSNFNTAYVANSIAVSAQTGLNTASSTFGDAGIATGDAFAAANVINMVNTNVVGSDYLAFIMNAFGSWEGDLVLPPGSFFSAEGGSASGGEMQDNECCLGAVSVGNENTADIENNVGTGADSGSNDANGGSGATVDTGEAGAASNVMTIANTNILGNNLLLIYVRTMGNWSGHIFSLPSGVQIIGMDDGFIIDGFSSQLAGGPGGISSSTISNVNNAHLVNNVSATASTGGNMASAGGNASIATGNAYAAANVVNIANTNIIGRNWLLAIVNVFGNWQGDLAFGRPDLWVGAAAQGPSPLMDGATPRFTVTYRNNGNAPATQSQVSFTYGSNLHVTDTGGGVVDEERGTITWDAGIINPGAFGSFSFAAQVHGTPVGNSQGSIVAMADMHEDDGNVLNNSDELKLDYYNKPQEGFLGYSQIYARLEIAKERKGADTAHPGDEVEYVITIENKGAGHAYNVVVGDEMRNENGDEITAQHWNLDTVYPGEKVVIEYTVAFADNTPLGTYTNYALAKWYDELGNYVDHSGHKSASVEIVENPNVSSNENTNGNASTTPDGSLEDANGVGGDGDMASTSEDVAVVGVNDEDVAKLSHTIVVYEGGHEADDILADENPVYITDARPLDASLAGELARSRKNPWDPRNLFANIALSSIGYSTLWALLAAVVVYLVSRKRKEA